MARDDLKEQNVRSLHRFVGRAQGIHEKIAKTLPNQVECDTCGRKQIVNVAECLRSGWPLCCGETMKLNGPVTPNKRVSHAGTKTMENQKAQENNEGRSPALAAPACSAARCRHDEHDEACDQLAKALGDWLGEQTFAGSKIKHLRLRPIEETLRWRVPPNIRLCDSGSRV